MLLPGPMEPNLPSPPSTSTPRPLVWMTFPQHHQRYKIILRLDGCLTVSGCLSNVGPGGYLSLEWQRRENVQSGQPEKSPLELGWGQRRKGDRSSNLQDGREHRRYPGRESRTCEGENSAEGAPRNGLNNRGGDKSRNIWIEGLGWVKREGRQEARLCGEKPWRYQR